MSNSLYGKTHIQRDEAEDQRARQQTDKWIFYVLIAAIGLVPLLVGGHVSEVVSPLISDKSILLSGTKGDIFTFYKFVALMIFTIAAVGLFLFKLFFLDYRLPKRPILLFFAIFIIAILVSTMFSPDKTIALYGQYNRTDGAFSYICYVLLMFVAMHIEYPKRAVEYVLYAFYPLVIINFILITMNFNGHDALTYPAMQKAMSIFLPEGSALGAGSTILGTLNQWNYMSGMFSIVTVMYVAWVVIDKNNIRRLINLVVALLSLATMLMATSTSGFFTFVCITPLLIWLAIKSANKKMAFLTLIAFYVLAAPILHVLASKNPGVWSESIGFFVSKNPYVVEQPVATSFNNNDSWKPTNLLETTAFAAKEKFALPVLPEREMAAGSGRAYIWGKALELTMERPIFGYGLDTLMYNFPHDNLDARAGMYYETVLVDKPHSMYVGIGYGTGIVGLIGFLGLAVLTVWAVLKAVIRFNAASGIAVTLGIAWIAFLIQSLFNDSLPGTAAPLWTLAGIMMAFFYKQKEIKE